MSKEEIGQYHQAMPESPPRLCKDCRHYEPGLYSLKAGGRVRREQCNAPENASLVDGRPRLDPEQARYGVLGSNGCGTYARWFKAKG